MYVQNAHTPQWKIEIKWMTKPYRKESFQTCEFCVEWGRSPKLEVARSIANNICRANKMSDCTLPNKTIKYCFMRGKWNNNSRRFRNLLINRYWNKFSKTVGFSSFRIHFGIFFLDLETSSRWHFSGLPKIYKVNFRNDSK